MRRALVTGASGFLGSYLTRALAGSWDVVGTYAHRAPEASGHFCRTDLGHADEVEAILNEFRPEALVHAAASSRFEWLNSPRWLRGERIVRWIQRGYAGCWDGRDFPQRRAWPTSHGPCLLG